MTQVCLSCGGDLILLLRTKEQSGRVAECSVCHMLHTVKVNDKGEIMEAGQDIRSSDIAPERKELLEKLRILQTRHNEVKGTAKAVAKDYREQLADIDGEIKDTLAALEE